MLSEIFKFELSYQRRQYLVYVLSGVFFLIMFMATTTPNVSIVGGVDNLRVNATYTVIMSLSALTLFAMFGCIAFSAGSVVRDRDFKTIELFYSSPVSRFDYVFGRFFGTLTFAYIVYLAGFLGVFMGEFMPWLDAERIGPVPVDAYLFALIWVALPNLFVFSALFFFFATLTRNLMFTYVAAVAMLMISLVLDTFTQKDMVELTSFLDPFGVTALEAVTRYWTVIEKNEQIPGLTGAFLYNRLFWLTIGIAALAASYLLFPFNLDKARKNADKVAATDASEVPVAAPLAVPYRSVLPVFGSGTLLLQYYSQTKIEIRNIIYSIPFVVLLLMGLLSVVANAAGNLGEIFGTPVYPTTSVMVDIINGSFSLSLLAVLIYYSGELLSRERAVKVSEIFDALPYPNWVMLAAKMSGLLFVLVSMMLIAMFAAMGVQIYHQYYDFQIMHYLLGLLFFFQFPLYLMAVLAVFFYAVTRNKFISMFLMIVYFAGSLALPAAGFEHYLYRLRQTYPAYSDFTGYGQNLEPHLWQTAYWSFFACLLLIATHLLWQRGIVDGWGARMMVVRQRMTRTVVVSIWAFSTLWVLSGGYIYYNTVILNAYETRKDKELAQAEYEKRYKQYQFLPMPVLTDVFAEVDIDPVARDVFLKGHYQLVNNTALPQEELHFSYRNYLQLEMNVPGAELTTDDALGYRIYRFDQPLAAGESIRVDFSTNWTTPGFANNGHSLKVTSNGTFIDNSDFFPLPGYQNEVELGDNSIRRQYELEPLQRALDLDEPNGTDRSALGLGERVNFETIVSTSLDQIAVAPGYLQRQWQEGSKHYFHYKMDVPIWNFYAYLSADYEVLKEDWNGLSIEIYYLHDFNVERMVTAVKDSIGYFSEHFSDYQYRQFRILEFPQYQGTFAQSFPNTIPFSEAIGFVADLRDEEEIDYVYYVTAHEVAHQWWAHQVLPADVQGSSMIIETLAQYSALMVMEQDLWG